MATAAKINIKNIDYFKFKKIVIDGNRDDYGCCSKEVKSLCDSVQTLSFRDDEFDDVSDRLRFDEIISYYRQIMASKRIDPMDMRIKNGWWVDANSGNVCSAGKFKPGALKETLVAKSKDWIQRHGATIDLKAENVPEKLEGPGLYVFKHKEHQCFQYVGRADKIFSRCAEKLKSAFDGTLNEPLGALMIISMASDWDFYFIPIKPNDGPDVLRILENDVILRHDSIWPHGLNFSLHIDSLLEVSEFRKSCLRHRWPPETDTVDEPEISLDRLRRLEKSGSPGNDVLKLENGGSLDAVDAHSPSDSAPRLPPSREKTPSENGHVTEQQPNTSEHQETTTRKMASTTKQPASASAPRKIARPSSAPKPPPPKQSAPPRAKSPALPKETAKRGDVLHRSLDCDDQRGPRPKSSGGKRPLDRPRSSLGGSSVEEAPRTIIGAPDSKGGMTRSKSVSSTTSIDSKKEKTTTTTKEPGKASGIKAPTVQVTTKRRPPTAKQKPPSPEALLETTPNNNTS